MQYFTSFTPTDMIWLPLKFVSAQDLRTKPDPTVPKTVVVKDGVAVVSPESYSLAAS